MVKRVVCLLALLCALAVSANAIPVWYGGDGFTSGQGAGLVGAPGPLITAGPGVTIGGVAVDLPGNRFFVSDGTTVNVYNMTTGDPITSYTLGDGSVGFLDMSYFNGTLWAVSDERANAAGAVIAPFDPDTGAFGLLNAIQLPMAAYGLQALPGGSFLVTSVGLNDGGSFVHQVFPGADPMDVLNNQIVDLFEPFAGETAFGLAGYGPDNIYVADAFNVVHRFQMQIDGSWLSVEQTLVQGSGEGVIGLDAAVPEPATMLMMLGGIVLLAVRRKAVRS